MDIIIPTDLYSLISSFMSNILDLISLSTCCRNSYLGALNHKKYIMKKYDRLAVWSTFKADRKYDKPFYYLKWSDFCNISKLEPYERTDNHKFKIEMGYYNYDVDGNLPFHLRRQWQRPDHAFNSTDAYINW